MNILPARLHGALIIEPRVSGDKRGFFLESYSRPLLREHGIDTEFIQDNHSRSEATGVLRGLHFQLPPMTQAKLVRVTQGSVMDVIVDLRKGSPTFGQWESFELSATNFRILFVPAGFAHGFCTTRPQTEVQYKVDAPYSPRHEAAIAWNDPDLAIPWPIQDPQLSDKDRTAPPFAGFLSPF